jgi:hypothetical protein
VTSANDDVVEDAEATRDAIFDETFATCVVPRRAHAAEGTASSPLDNLVDGMAHGTAGLERSLVRPSAEKCVGIGFDHQGGLVGLGHGGHDARRKWHGVGLVRH